MNFNSIEYYIFLILVLIVYYILKRNIYRNIWLLAASYFFYYKLDAKYAVLMLGITCITYICGRFMQNRREKRLFLFLGIAICLLILAIFKYCNFFLENINLLRNKLEMEAISMPISIILPIGISFYTFQAIGYVIDVYRGEMAAECNFFKYALYISFFPQLVAGPIERAGNMLPQFSEYHSLNEENVRKGGRLILFGLFEKIALADVSALYVNQVYNNIYSYHGLTLILATGLFAIQIYGDFAGYSNIARGSALLLGFRLSENFRAPYLSESPGEFYHRWHISLSTWFRDYIYYPMGGSRKGNVYVHLLVVMIVSGIWHGAAWHYILWGVFWGVVICIDKILKKRKCLENKEHLLRKIIGTGIIVCFGWGIFRVNSIADLGYLLQNILRFGGWNQFVAETCHIESAIYFKSISFGMLFIGTILMNMLLLGWIDARLKFCRKPFMMMEDVFYNIDKIKKNAIYVYMLVNIFLWTIISKGAYVATTDFIYFQF